MGANKSPRNSFMSIAPLRNNTSRPPAPAHSSANVGISPLAHMRAENNFQNMAIFPNPHVEALSNMHDVMLPHNNSIFDDNVHTDINNIDINNAMNMSMNMNVQAEPSSLSGEKTLSNAMNKLSIATPISKNVVPQIAKRRKLKKHVSFAQTNETRFYKPELPGIQI